GWRSSLVSLAPVGHGQFGPVLVGQCLHLGDLEDPFSNAAAALVDSQAVHSEIAAAARPARPAGERGRVDRAAHAVATVILGPHGGVAALGGQAVVADASPDP